METLVPVYAREYLFSSFSRERERERESVCVCEREREVISFCCKYTNRLCMYVVE